MAPANSYESVATRLSGRSRDILETEVRANSEDMREREPRKFNRVDRMIKNMTKGGGPNDEDLHGGDKREICVMSKGVHTCTSLADELRTTSSQEMCTQT